jgi:CRISPR system Cascade subunit CasA
MENKFNLVEEKWIPVTNDLVSIKDLFSKDFSTFGKNAIEKISIFKFLLGICQAAYTPKNDEELNFLTIDMLKEKVLTYLDEKKDCFWLYGDKPFLQMQAIEKAALCSIKEVTIGVVAGNLSLFYENQNKNIFSDAEKALMLLVLQNFALGGKKTDNNVTLSSSYEKEATSKCGPALGYKGFLHSFFIGKNVLQTLFLNIISEENIKTIPMFSYGLGKLICEEMPTSENCERANEISNSYLGRLIPLSRFVLLNENFIHYSDGIKYKTYKESVSDLTTCVNITIPKKEKAIWTDTTKKPWLQLSSILSFVSLKNDNFTCLQLKLCFNRAKKIINQVGIWTGGFSINGQSAGEQFCNNRDSFVESEYFIDSKLFGIPEFSLLEKQMEIINKIAEETRKATLRYFKQQGCIAKNKANDCKNIFFQLTEPYFQKIINSCENKTPQIMHSIFKQNGQKAYDLVCKNNTSKQLMSWIFNKPTFSKCF